VAFRAREALQSNPVFRSNPVVLSHAKCHIVTHFLNSGDRDRPAFGRVAVVEWVKSAAGNCRLAIGGRNPSVGFGAKPSGKSGASLEPRSTRPAWSVCRKQQGRMTTRDRGQIRRRKANHERGPKPLLVSSIKTVPKRVRKTFAERYRASVSYRNGAWRVESVACREALHTAIAVKKRPGQAT
jgi:hypothetical protein